MEVVGKQAEKVLGQIGLRLVDTPDLRANGCCCSRSSIPLAVTSIPAPNRNHHLLIKALHGKPKQDVMVPLTPLF